MGNLLDARRWLAGALVALAPGACTDDGARDVAYEDSTARDGGGGDGDGDGDAERPSEPAAGGIPCAVQAVLSEHCTSCHASPPRFGAPIPLTAQSHFAAAGSSDPARPVHELARARIAEDDPRLRMPPASQAALEPDELAALDAWLEAGAPRSDETCSPGDGDGDGDDDGDGGVDTRGLVCHDLLAHAPGDLAAPYAVGTARDLYINFSFAAPWQGAGYGIVMRPKIDNEQVVHHWLLFMQNGVVDGDIAESDSVHPTGDLVYVWTPGGGPMDYREHGDVGFEFPAGTGFVLELHYNSSDAAALDRSGVELCVQQEPPANLAAVSWLGRDWFTFVNTQSSVCNPRDESPIHILAVSPHMHLKGRHLTGVINRAGGATEILHDAPFSFDDQAWYKKDVTLLPGDTITTTCTWDGFVNFGTATTDEMCYLFAVAYPKGALADGLPAGTAAHGGSACLGL